MKNFIGYLFSYLIEFELSLHFISSDFKRLIGNSIEKINQKNILNPNECGEKFFQILWANIPQKYKIKRLVLTAPIDTYKGYREWLVNL